MRFVSNLSIRGKLIAIDRDPTARTYFARFEKRAGVQARGAVVVMDVHSGDILVSRGGAATSAELAKRAGIDERYAREWLEQQAATGILEVEGEAREDGHGSALPAVGLREGGGAVVVHPLRAR